MTFKKNRVPRDNIVGMKVLDVARRQQAKALELHTAMSLSRLWQSRGALLWLIAPPVIA
jgi:hypothetical protein